MPKRTSYIAAAIVSILVLTGCSPSGDDDDHIDLSLSQGDVDQFRSETALLDHELGTIVLPLDAFEMTRDERIKIDRANDVLIDQCLQSAGLRSPFLGKVDRRDAPPDIDRRYGPWTSNVNQFGYEVPPNPVSDQISELLSAQDQTFSNADAKCYEETKLLPTLTYEDSEALAPGSVVALGTRGAIEAYVYAQDEPDWTAARSEWWDCMRDQGVTPRTGATEWVPEIPSDPESAIRTAVIDVACKDKVNLVQRLANLEAQYQAAFVAANKAALNAQRKDVDAELQQADGILGVG